MHTAQARCKRQRTHKHANNAQSIAVQSALCRSGRRCIVKLPVRQTRPRDRS